MLRGESASQALKFLLQSLKFGSQFRWCPPSVVWYSKGHNTSSDRSPPPIIIIIPIGRSLCRGMRMAAEDGATKGVSGGGGHRNEMLVCFPARASMSLMPKPILSPGRGSGDPARRLRNSASRGQSSPMFSIHATEGRKKNSASYEIEEPSSPKVTCVGQVRVKPRQCSKSWQSVMEEIEKLHGQKHQQRRVPCRPRGPGAPGSPASSPRARWSQAFGLKRELLQLLAALRNFRIDFGCFGAAAAAAAAAREDDAGIEPATSGSTVFAKWFMILQDNDEERKWGAKSEGPKDRGPHESSEEPAVPPPNALLLMRCRSAPSRGSSPMDSCSDARGDEGKRSRIGAEGASKKNPNAVVLMRCESDFLEASKETWIGRPDFMRSLSLKG